MSIVTNLWNGRRKYSLAVGIVLLIASFGFLTIRWMTDAARLDAFLPSIFAIVSLVLAVAFFFMGLSAENCRGDHKVK